MQKRKEIVMTRKFVTDDQYGKLQRRLEEVARRVDEGTLPLDTTIDALQVLIEGRSENRTYPMTINYSLSLAGMIRKARLDGYVNPNITAEHFPITGEGEAKVTIELVPIDRPMTDEEITVEFNRRGLRDATL